MKTEKKIKVIGNDVHSSAGMLTTKDWVNSMGHATIFSCDPPCYGTAVGSGKHGSITKGEFQNVLKKVSKKLC